MIKAISIVFFGFCFALVCPSSPTSMFSQSDQRSSCGIPSAFWCDSVESAKRCGVYKQCQLYEWSKNALAEPVQLALYFESLCPDCQMFFAEELFPAYHFISDIINLTLVPYGNAQETKVGNKWKFQCQHGGQECIGNIIETCAIAYMKNVTAHLTFIHCIEVSNLSPVDAAKMCAQKTQAPIEDIFTCLNSTQGNQLEHEMAVKTDALIPKHTYVPWVTINGVHTEAIQKLAQTDLIKLVCMTYRGTKPPICSASVSKS